MKLIEQTKKKFLHSIYSWYFESVSRKEADKLLLADENPRGTFLVRPSEHNPNGYSLSVKDWEDGRGYHVKHYKIKPLDNGGYYIATNQTFPSLPALVLAYSSKYRSLSRDESCVNEVQHSSRHSYLVDLRMLEKNYTNRRVCV